MRGLWPELCGASPDNNRGTMSDTITSTSGQFTATIQGDGNLVLSDWGVPYWGSGTVRPIRPNPNPPPVPPPVVLPRLRVNGHVFAQDIED